MLTPAQKIAVERVGQDVCVVAGPGSGKTRVLVERFAWLVEEQATDPTRILAITFTEKAAIEIKQRLIERFRTRFKTRPDLRERIERAWVSTIHGFCARLLRENAIAAGLAPDFTVLEQPAAERLLRDSAEESLNGLYRERPAEMRRLLEAVDLSTQDDGRQPDLAASLIAVYEAMRVSGTRELPAVRPSPHMFDAARQLVASIAGPTGKTDLQRIAHAHLGEWAEQFLELPREPLTLEHFRLTHLDVNLARLAHGKAREAAAELKNVILPRLEAQFLEVWNADLVDLLRAAVARIDALYRERKRTDAVLDFSDLEEETIRLLASDPAALRETAGRFDEILMDELQDTNRLQWRLVNLIRRRLFAVGDINQSIYSFRSAEPAVFEEYRDGIIKSGGTVDDLRENHRSTAEILEAVSRMLDGQPGIEPRPLIAALGRGAAVERLVGRADPGATVDAADVEANLVASRIRLLTDSGEFEYCDIAILTRTMNAAEPLARALDRFGIPFLVSGGRMFFEAREIRDVIMLLAALVNPLDDIAVVGVLRSPLAGVSDEELFRNEPGKGWRGLFEKRFGHLRPLAGFVTPDRLLATALDQSGYLADLSERARANIEKFLAYVRREHRNRPLAELLDDLEGLRTMQAEAEAPPSDAGNIVRLMSIHAAKGLEFPVVFVSALHKGPDRSKAVVAFSSAAGLGVKWRNPVTGKGQSDTAHALILEQLKKKEEAEENRLLYVAMTRAKRRLILSHAEKGRVSSNWCKLAQAVPDRTDIVLSPPTGKRAAPMASATSSILAVDPPIVTGQYDSVAAVTSVTMFEACPRKYFLNSLVQGENRGRGPGGIATGLAVHRVLAGEIAGSVEEAGLAGRFSSSELGRRAGRASRIEREFDFLFYLEDVVLRGQIDLWFEEGGELVVVDYKTDRDESSAEVYALQLRLYALALERYANRLPDRAVLYYLRPDKAVEVSLDETKLQEARNAVRVFRDAQESLDFPMHPGEQCPRCPFFKDPCAADAEFNPRPS